MYYPRWEMLCLQPLDWQEAGEWWTALSREDWQQIQIIMNWLLLPQNIFTLYWHRIREGHRSIMCNLLSELDLRWRVLSPLSSWMHYTCSVSKPEFNCSGRKRKESTREFLSSEQAKWSKCHAGGTQSKRRLSWNSVEPCKWSEGAEKLHCISDTAETDYSKIKLRILVDIIVFIY